MGSRKDKKDGFTGTAILGESESLNPLTLMGRWALLICVKLIGYHFIVQGIIGLFMPSFAS